LGTIKGVKTDPREESRAEKGGFVGRSNDSSRSPSRLTGEIGGKKTLVEEQSTIDSTIRNGGKVSSSARSSNA